jgi:hypothetical protein
MKTAASRAVSNAAESLASLFDEQIAPDPTLAPATDAVIRPLPNRSIRPVRNASARLRRPLAVLAALVVGLLASAATVPAAFAMIPDPGGAAGVASVPAPAVRVVVTGGMAGWEITSIAIGSALFAATAAVLLYRALAARKPASAATA